MRASSVRAEPRNLEPQLGLETQPRLDPTAERLVRKSAAAPGIHREYQGQAKRPAHPSNRLVTQLNERWSVADDPLQWILQRRKGSPRNKNSGWRGRSFCRTKDALLRCIREHCCSPDQGQLRSIREYNGVDKVALQQVRALPDWHPDCDRQNDHTNLDVLGTDEAHSGVQGIWRLRCWRIAIRKSSLCSLLV